MAPPFTVHFVPLREKYHPDAGPDSSTTKLSETLEAYRTLSDPALRRNHDLELAEAARPPRIVVEPLFAFPSLPRTHTIFISPGWEQLPADLLRLMEEDVAIPSIFGRAFF